MIRFKYFFSSVCTTIFRSLHYLNNYMHRGSSVLVLLLLSQEYLSSHYSSVVFSQSGCVKLLLLPLKVGHPGIQDDRGAGQGDILPKRSANMLAVAERMDLYVHGIDCGAGCQTEGRGINQEMVGKLKWGGRWWEGLARHHWTVKDFLYLFILPSLVSAFCHLLPRQRRHRLRGKERKEGKVQAASLQSIKDQRGWGSEAVLWGWGLGG